MYAQAAQQLGPHLAMQPQPSALRLVYTPQIIRKAVPAPAIVQHTLTSIAAVQAYRATRAISWHPLQNDDTIPRNEAVCLLFVDTFLSSLTEVHECVNEERKPFPTHWTTPAKQGRFYYEEDDMANAAWDLLDIMMALHLFGPSALKTCKPGDIAEITKDEGMSFKGRAGRVCNVLRLSKHRPAMVIAGDSVEAFVALVSRKEREPESNSTNNKMRPSNLKTLKAQLKAAEDALANANANANSSNSASTAPTVAAAMHQPTPLTPSFLRLRLRLRLRQPLHPAVLTPARRLGPKARLNSLHPRTKYTIDRRIEDARNLLLMIAIRLRSSSPLMVLPPLKAQLPEAMCARAFTSSKPPRLQMTRIWY